MTVLDNLNKIHQRIERACAKADKNPENVQIVAVTKTVAVERIEEALQAGIHMIGENKVQEAWMKYPLIGSKAAWHFIGHLQTNKVKRALQFSNVIESLDSLHLAREIQTKALDRAEPIEVFVQVNTSGEKSKFGINPADLPDFVYQLAELDKIRVTGLMTLGFYADDPEKVRPCFSLLRELKEHINQQKIPTIRLCHLSMGMTNDYEVAVEEGATLVRLGQALFGERK